MLSLIATHNHLAFLVFDFAYVKPPLRFVVELSRVKGIRPSKIEALQAAGITTAQDLAQIDLRTGLDVDGVSRVALRSYKQRARQLLQREGIAFDNAPYAKDQPTKRKPAKSAAQPAATAPSTEPAPEKKRGFLGRLFGKS